MTASHVFLWSSFNSLFELWLWDIFGRKPSLPPRCPVHVVLRAGFEPVTYGSRCPVQVHLYDHELWPSSIYSHQIPQAPFLECWSTCTIMNSDLPVSIHTKSHKLPFWNAGLLLRSWTLTYQYLFTPNPISSLSGMLVHLYDRELWPTSIYSNHIPQAPFLECSTRIIHKLTEATPDHTCRQFEMAYQLVLQSRQSTGINIC